MELRALGVMAAAVALGCGGEPAAAGGDAGTDAGAPVSDCRGQLIEYCEGACPDFDDSVADVMQRAQTGRCVVAESGACGDGRYTAYSSGFFGFTAWFTTDGLLVAAHVFEDTPSYCDASSYDKIFGMPPACAPAPSARYCPE